MGWIKELVRPSNLASPWTPVQPFQDGKPQIQPANYQGYAKEGYSGNELVFACINELATSAAEPTMRSRNGDTWRTNHRIIQLLDRPNPFMDRFAFWATVIMYRSIAGNAYAVKVRNASGRVAELWLLRPDRVYIVPDENRFIRRYEYDIGVGGRVPIPPEDMIHWKTRNPLDEFYGMPPLLPISGRIDVDNFMRDTTKAYMQNRGVPAALLTTKGKIPGGPTAVEEIQRRYGTMTGKLMVLDNTEAQFVPMNQALGAQGLVLPELNMISESRIAMVFGVPLSLIGTLAGAGNSSYGNKKSERESFWNETLKPLYRELVGPINLSLVNDYTGVEEVDFDLTSVGALSGDIDALWTRMEKALTSGLIGRKEARRLIGRPDDAGDDVFYIPSNLTQTPEDDIGELPALPAPSPNGAKPEVIGAGRGA